MKGLKHVLTAAFAIAMMVGLAATPVEAATPASQPQQYGCTYYRVVWGDTLSRLAVRFRTTVYQIQRANGLRGTVIYAGSVLCIPRYAPAPPPRPVYGPPPRPNPAPRPPGPGPKPQWNPGPQQHPWMNGYSNLPGLQGPPGVGWPGGWGGGPGGRGGWGPPR